MAWYRRRSSWCFCLIHAPLQPLLVESGGGMAVDKDMRFSFLAGILNEEDRVRFERMLFRATKGQSPSPLVLDIVKDLV